MVELDTGMVMELTYSTAALTVRMTRAGSGHVGSPSWKAAQLLLGPLSLFGQLTKTPDLVPRAHTSTQDVAVLRVLAIPPQRVSLRDG